MMVNKLNKPRASAKLVLTLGIAMAALWGFGKTKVVARQIQAPSQDVPTITNSKGEEIPLTIISLNDKVKVKFLSESSDWIEKLYGELTKEELERFKKEESQGQYYIEKLAPLIPNEKLLEDFKDPNKYGIWIDNTPIANEKLENYTQKDFHHYTISKLLVGSKNYGKHEYQVDLTSWSTYENSPYSMGGWRLYWDVIEKAKKGFEELKKDKEDSKIDTTQNKQNQDLPPPPPPRLVKINDNTQVRFQYANGDEVFGRFGQLNERQLKIFKSPEGKGQILLPPPPPAMITEELLNEFSDSKFKVWVDGERIKSGDLTNYEPEEFYLYNKQLTVSKDGLQSEITGIEFITRKEWKATGRDEGKWIPFIKDFIIDEGPVPNQEHPLNKKVKLEDEDEEPKQDNKKSYYPNDLSKYKKGDGPPEKFVKKIGEENIVSFITTSSSGWIRMIDDNGEIMVKQAKDFTKEEWFNWWDPDREGMLFSAPEAKSSVSAKQLMEWEEQPEKFTILVDGKEIANSDLLRYKFFSFYDFDTKALGNGKTQVSLISKDSFLAPEYYDKYWRRNVILKDGSKESMYVTEKLKN